MTDTVVCLNPSRGTVTLTCSNPDCDHTFEKSIKKYKEALARCQTNHYHSRQCYLQDKKGGGGAGAMLGYGLEWVSRAGSSPRAKS